ncbi:hypothetical protein [Kitasatospora sp. NPDC127116]|uniref:hypothetical protein n=1 Tax=Kitasatospora sp. NPDC127116 TaxID=3345367 RepID=UPI00362B0F9B
MRWIFSGSDRIINEPEVFRELFQELPPRGVGLGFGHRPEQVNQFAPLVARQLADQVGDTSRTLTASSESICSSSLPSMNHRTSTKASAKAWVRDEDTGMKAVSPQVTAAESGHPTTHH